MKVYPLIDEDGKIMEGVRKLDWRRDIPGGWLTYGPPREVCGYGDGSLYTDEGKKYGERYKETGWAGAIPLNQSTLVTKTDPLPKNLVKTTLMKQLRDCLRDYGANVDDNSCTGMWCNYYSIRSDSISAHTDDEDYYERNYRGEPLFVSLTLYEDEKKDIKDLARFQIKKDGKWADVKLPHLSLLVMSGGVEHRVMKLTSKMKFRKRYNITFRTPVKREVNIIKNYRFFSNFGRYYKIPYKLYIPEEEPKYDAIIEKYDDLEIVLNKDVTRKSILEKIRKMGYVSGKGAPSTTTTMSLYILYRSLKKLKKE